MNSSINEVKEVVKKLEPIVNGFEKRYASKLDKIVKEVTDNIENLSPSQMRMYMLKLNLEVYNLIDVKSKASLSHDIANAVYKSSYSEQYLNCSGTVENRRQQATVAMNDKDVVKLLYSNIESRMKDRVDLAIKLINTLSNILISVAAENKINSKLYE
jgi:hypothetical protein